MRKWLSSASPVLVSIAATLALGACTDGSRPLATAPRANEAKYDPALTATAPAPVFPSHSPRAFRSVVPGPGQVQLVVNGGFEANGGPNTSAFTGWTVFNQAGGDPNGFRVQQGTTSPATGGVFPVPAPPEGVFSAMSSQFGPGAHSISQDITLPPHGNGQLTFRLFIGNRAGAFVSPATLAFNMGANQQFRMDIMDPAAPDQDVGAGVLMNVYQTRPGDPLISAGYLTISADLSAFNGQTVRLRFAETDNQLWFNAGIDDVSVIAQVDPTTKEECKNGGWAAFGFRNQGQCVRFIETGKDSRTE